MCVYIYTHVCICMYIYIYICIYIYIYICVCSRPDGHNVGTEGDILPSAYAHGRTILHVYYHIMHHHTIYSYIVYYVIV